MPLNPPPTDPELPDAPTHEPVAPSDPNAPLSFVPHPRPGEEPTGPYRIRTNRYGALDEHELVRLLDSMDDERSRARFRESIYISSFICIVLALLILYGPHYLWHAPELINPADMMRKQELTELNAPVILHNTPQSAPKAAQERLDTKTIKQLQAMTRSRPTPTPPAPTNLPATPQPQPTTAPPPLVPTPQPTPRVNNAPIPEAPTPSAPTKPNFNTSNSASGSIADAVRQSAQSRGGGAGGNGMVQTAKGASVGGGVQVLSDLQGVNFDDYLRRLVENTRRAWIPLLPEETEPPISKQGETYIIFTILPDGTLAPPPAMKLEASSHDVALDKAAWGSLVSQGQFPPLPAKYHGPGLTLRFHFMVNKGIGQ